MAKDIYQRLDAALTNDGGRLTDLTGLHDEAVAERERQVALATQATADSLIIGLSDELTDAAAADAARAKRRAAALADAIGRLAAKIGEKRASASRKAAEEERQAIIAERDSLAQRFRNEWPVAEGIMVELLRLSAENAQRGRAAGINQASAEAEARGVTDNGMFGGVPGARLLSTMALPSFGNPRELAWPVPVQRIDYGEEIRRQRLAAQEAREAENRRWSRFAVTPPAKRPDEPVVIETRRGPMRLGRTILEAMMSEEGVAAAQAQGCEVSPLADNQFVGGPASAAYL
jgi:hypothetical protein